MAKKGHGASFPEKLAGRFIRLYSNQGDLIFDPFIGSGTTAIAAIQNERHFFGCDSNEEYVKMAQARIRKELSKPIQLELS